MARSKLPAPDREQKSNDVKTAALLCPSSGIGSSNMLRVVNVLTQIRAEKLYLEAYAEAIRKG